MIQFFMNLFLSNLIVHVSLTELGAELYNAHWTAKYTGTPRFMPVSKGYVVRTKIRVLNEIFSGKIELAVLKQELV